MALVSHTRTHLHMSGLDATFFQGDDQLNKREIHSFAALPAAAEAHTHTPGQRTQNALSEGGPAD